MLPKKGKLILAGAGSGDAELITVKLQKRLAEAEVILSDRLVNPAIIELYANKNAEVILTGKQMANDASCSQATINELIATYALQGKNILRLKGGDVAFYSNVLDELQTAVKYNLEYEIIPGITAASAASAYAAIPLTAREYAQGVQFLSYNPNNQYSIKEWQYFAACNDTLVFYMTARNVFSLAQVLMQHSKDAETPLAIVEQASTKYQKVYLSTLKDCEKDFSNITFASPSIVIVGNVVQLHQQFKWFKTTEEKGSIFKELSQPKNIIKNAARSETQAVAGVY